MTKSWTKRLESQWKERNESVVNEKPWFQSKNIVRHWSLESREQKKKKVEPDSEIYLVTSGNEFDFAFSEL